MIETFIQYLDRLQLIKHITAFINAIPFPYSHLPVSVHGHKMTAHKSDRYLALWLWKLGLLGKTELTFLSKLCQPNMHIVDIGANVGLYSLIFAMNIGQNGKVWAFEPDVGNFDMLKRNIQHNQYYNIMPIQKAVSNQSGIIKLYISDYHNGDHRTYQTTDKRTAIEIESVSLDDFFVAGERIDLIKMDIQGAEGFALQGMTQILKNNPQVKIFTEFWPFGLQQAGFESEKMISDLQACGFNIKYMSLKTNTWKNVDNPTEVVTELEPNKYTNLLVDHNP
ncbi:MAG: hypothetical protein B6242_00195 [Anaerolineaceae bacterium 4572_78]|nr:MAG: hypothetical protein B6242_00195 [Anaerolineaceae bacterium 4572_78]